MIADLDLYGVFVPALLLWSVIAAALTFLLRFVLRATGLVRLIWHPALFDVAAFVILLGGVIAVGTAWTQQ